jgi:hypothetical protein
MGSHPFASRRCIVGFLSWNIVSQKTANPFASVPTYRMRKGVKKICRSTWNISHNASGEDSPGLSYSIRLGKN